MNINFDKKDIEKIAELVRDKVANEEFISYDELESRLSVGIRPDSGNKSCTEWRGYVSARGTLIKHINAYVFNKYKGTESFFILRSGIDSGAEDADEMDMSEFGCTKMQGDASAEWKSAHAKTKLRRAPMNAYDEASRLLKHDVNMSVPMRKLLTNQTTILAMLSEASEQVIEYASSHVNKITDRTKKRLALLSTEHEEPDLHFANLKDKLREENK